MNTENAIKLLEQQQAELESKRQELLKAMSNPEHSKPKAGRPKSDKILGYKAKIGGRYFADNGEMTTELSKGKVFPTPDSFSEIAKCLTHAVQTGEVKHHGLEGGRTQDSYGRIRVEFIPVKTTGKIHSFINDANQ